jgi:phenylacetate-CoA ligase
VCSSDLKDGLTIWEDHFYPEVIDPETGRVLPDGEKGELVFTSLTKEALPIIRYRTRDLTRLLPATARSMRRMEKITGRSDDMIIIRGVNVFPTQVEELILKQEALRRIRSSRSRAPRRSTEHTVLSQACPPGRCGAEGAAGVKLAHHIRADRRQRRGAVVQSGGIERSLGKAKRVVDKRPKL